MREWGRVLGNRGGHEAASDASLPRMREIEAARFQQGDPLKSTPQIDWSWSNASSFLSLPSLIRDPERRASAIDQYQGGVWRTWFFWLGGTFACRT